MAAASTLKNMALCLTSVCFVCAAVLGGVYTITEQPIKDAAQKATVAAIAEVLPEGLSVSEVKTAEGFEYYEGVHADGNVAAYAVKSATTGFGGELLLMVGVLPDGTIWQTKVLSHSETPGLGAKCTSDKAFMDQWHNFNGKMLVRKDGGDIDAITASTITSRAYTKAVAAAQALVKSFAGAQYEAVSGASQKSEE